MHTEKSSTQQRSCTALRTKKKCKHASQAGKPAFHPGCQRRSLGATRGTEPPEQHGRVLEGLLCNMRRTVQVKTSRRLGCKVTAAGRDGIQLKTELTQPRIKQTRDSQRRSSCVASHWPASPPSARSPAAGLELGQASRRPATAARRKPRRLLAAAYDPWHFEGTSRFLGVGEGFSLVREEVPERETGPEHQSRGQCRNLRHSEAAERRNSGSAA